jgi:hypothetical protein
MSENEGTKITIRKANLQVLDVELLGATDLICSSAPKQIAKITDKAARKAKALKGNLPDDLDAAEPTGGPDDQFRASLYRVEGADGFFFPSSAIQRALATYLQRFNPINPKYARDTSPVVYGATFMVDEMLPIVAVEGPIMRHDIARNSRGKLIDVYRGSFKGWKLNARIEFDADVITKDRLLDGLHHAGRKVGIGAWRPERSGRFGRFTLGAVSLTKGSAEEVAA